MAKMHDFDSCDASSTLAQIALFLNKSNAAVDKLVKSLLFHSKDCGFEPRRQYYLVTTKQ